MLGRWYGCFSKEDADMDLSKRLKSHLGILMNGGAEGF